ncbi:hypothetical protein D3C80_1563220 [compost metagenome]
MLETVSLKLGPDFLPDRAVEIGQADPQIVRVEIDPEREKSVRIDLDGSGWLPPFAVAARFLGFQDQAGFQKIGRQAGEGRCGDIHLARQFDARHASLAAQDFEQTPFIVAEVDQPGLPREVKSDD